MEYFPCLSYRYVNILFLGTLIFIVIRCRKYPKQVISILNEKRRFRDSVSVIRDLA